MNLKCDLHVCCHSRPGLTSRMEVNNLFSRHCCNLQSRRYMATERSINVNRVYMPQTWMLNGRGLCMVMHGSCLSCQSWNGVPPFMPHTMLCCLLLCCLLCFYLRVRKKICSHLCSAGLVHNEHYSSGQDQFLFSNAQQLHSCHYILG